MSGVRKKREHYQMLRCGTHGFKRWRGHLVCAKCERLFTTHDPSLSTHAPVNCPCGARLAPGKDPSGAEYDFSARSVCADCYAARKPALRGVS